MFREVVSAAVGIVEPASNRETARARGRELKTHDAFSISKQGAVNFEVTEDHATTRRKKPRQIDLQFRAKESVSLPRTVPVGLDRG